MRFLHLADVHLDTPFPGRTQALRARLREASREALRRSVDVALEESVDAVLIAGDLFDGERLSFDSERFLLDQLHRLYAASIPVVYATGNHDAGAVGSRARDLPWPANVTVVAGPQPRRIRVTDTEGTLRGWVTAAGHGTSNETSDLSLAFPRPEGGVPEVALLHTQVHRARSSDRHGSYAPSSLERLAAAGFDYWALGHVHARQTLHRAPLVAYSGNPQGRTFGETGPKGCLLVDLSDRGAPLTTFVETGGVRWEILRVDDLEECRTLDQLIAAVARQWEEARRIDPGDPDSEWVVRVELRGATPLARDVSEEENRDALANEVRTALGLLWVEVWAHDTHPPAELADHYGREDVLGEALRLMARLRAGDEGLEALDPGDLAGFDGERGPDRATYLRELLDSAGSELILRMLQAERP